MNKRYYKTDFLFSKSSFIIGAGSILSIASPYYTFNCAESAAEADRLALESDFGMVGIDIRKASSEYEK